MMARVKNGKCSDHLNGNSSLVQIHHSNGQYSHVYDSKGNPCLNGKYIL